MPPQQMLVYKGGKIRNWGGECRDVTPTKLQYQNIFKESTGGGGGGGGGGHVGGSEFFFLGGGGGGGGGGRVELEGGQGRCEQISFCEN